MKIQINVLSSLYKTFKDLKDILNFYNFFKDCNERTGAEFKEFEPRLKFKTRLKDGWFHLKL